MCLEKNHRTLYNLLYNINYDFSIFLVRDQKINFLHFQGIVHFYLSRKRSKLSKFIFVKISVLIFFLSYWPKNSRIYDYFFENLQPFEFCSQTIFHSFNTFSARRLCSLQTTLPKFRSDAEVPQNILMYTLVK